MDMNEAVGFFLVKGGGGWRGRLFATLEAELDENQYISQTNLL